MGFCFVDAIALNAVRPARERLRVEACLEISQVWRERIQRNGHTQLDPLSMRGTEKKNLASVLPRLGVLEPTNEPALTPSSYRHSP